ncbi:MAG: GNAT family N-acetyltransferase [Jatrophihabitans sp.]
MSTPAPPEGGSELLSLQTLDLLPITTDRLILRRPTGADVDAVLAYRSRPDVCRYLPFEPQTRERVTGQIADVDDQLTRSERTLWLMVEVAETGVLIGDVILFVRGLVERGGEVGYVFAPEAAGNGYATEATAALVDFGFRTLGMHRIVGRLDDRNGPSARVLERIGMRREALFVRNEWFKGEWADEAVYAVLEDEWQQP